MKALVLAGGTGTRLRPITHTSSKQLVPVANKPILFYGLEAIAAAGITEVGVIVGSTAAEIEAAVGDGSDFGVRVTYIPQSEPLGLAHAVLVARPFLGDDDFVMYLGDNFVLDGITDVVDEFRKEPCDAQILLTRVPDPTAFGVATTDEHGNVLGLEEKPSRPRSDLAVAGVYLFTPVVHEAIDLIEPSARGELEITDALQRMIDKRLTVRSTVIPGYWKDTGNVTDMLEVNRTLLERLQPCTEGTVDEESQIVGRVRIEKGAEVRRSRIVGPAIIGAGTLVSDSYVGPSTSVAENCRIIGSEIEFSIVLRDSSFDRVRRIEGSLVGRNVSVSLAPRLPATHRLVIGDHGQVQISS
ncbi:MULTISPECIES: glucose-1-phosphate thymidylyltransferase [Streptomyces]|uniref:Glucose-1-phosphate thymidylyltransferase n=1 Tax=Streptomyces albus (strain ATCC 21838 / DSM 41398 / FERM P-419 / JCM 4703 / NBRC 107858) TaxID=1081613 RepID=A0A0B5EG87_STRA4|nr:glucose-1-phosphate thymidylyltransferase [Streptomyces sp. SCSIO ZS0520]AJE81078.1 glucose-1-phosphate thymidylyltransferase [Streptomyces albus]AOU75391.1 glucose-1-phosphate thymidylyltransferase [Streptomyces albus]AYN31196.1 glucose-1-phosphate thymidylyltransferase [Streptomyces albus]